jgi:single-strand DNA-binding protein
MQVLIGRITTDAKVNALKDDKQVVNFSIALNHSYKNKEGDRKEQTTFVNCAYWRNTTIATYLTKGTLVEVAGHLTANAYTDMQGKAKASINFHTNEITLHGKAKAAEETEQVKKSKKKISRKTSDTEPQAGEVTEPIDDLPF